MFALEPQDFGRIRGLLDAVPFNSIFAQVIVDGDLPGEVWVDDRQQPAACYIRHPYGMALLCGESGREAFRVGLQHHLAGESGQRATAEYLQVFPASWLEQVREWLEAAIRNGRALEDTRLNFAFIPELFAQLELAPLADSETIVATTAAMVDQLAGSVVPRHFWRDGRQFERAGKGFSLIKSGVIAATAFASFVKGHQLEIGIETHEQHRGRGLALKVCARLISHCLDSGLEPVWSCRETNRGSVRLANRLGFMVTRRMPYFRLVG